MTHTATIPTDLLTPLAAYLRLRGMGRASFLLESVERGRLGRASWMGAGTRLVTFAEAEELGVPVVGYVAYDHVARLEPTVPLPDAGHELPESRLIVAETLVRFDHGAGAAEVMVGDHEEVAGRLDAGIPWRREAPRRRRPRAPLPRPGAVLAMVRKVKEHIVLGDVFQCVPSQRAERPTSATPLEVYRALRRVNPSPYLFLLELDGLALVGSSPERLVACEGGRASLCPIAGTTDPTEGDVDRLLSSEKDRAEHVMLVDLGRNDLSRVCRAGTVHIARSMEVERFSHVSHLVSEVVGEVREGVSPFDVLRACFPGRDGERRSEDPGDAADLGARGLPSRSVRRRRPVLPPGRHHGRVHHAPDDDHAGRHRLSPSGGGHRRGLGPGRRARGMPAETRRARGRNRPRRTGARAMTRPLATADGHEALQHSVTRSQSAARPARAHGSAGKGSAGKGSAGKGSAGARREARVSESESDTSGPVTRP